MDKQQQIERLRRELAILEGKTVDEPISTPTTEADTTASLRQFFEDEERNAKATEQRKCDEENRINKLCPNCYFRQSVANERCSLCGETHESWLPSMEPDRPPNQPARAERSMLASMAAKFSLSELRTASHSSWTAHGDRHERERFLRVLIPLREAQERALSAARKDTWEPPSTGYQGGGFNIKYPI